MRRKSQRMPLAITITAESNRSFGDGYFHVHGRPVTWEDGKARGFASSYDPINGIETFENLRISCQGEYDRRSRGVYGFDAVYREPYTVDERMAEKMFKSLRTINRRLAKMREAEGSTHTYGEYVARFARAIGATEILFATRKADRHSEMRYRRFKIADGAREIDALIARWQETGQHVETWDLVRESETDAA